ESLGPTPTSLAQSFVDYNIEPFARTQDRQAQIPLLPRNRNRWDRGSQAKEAAVSLAATICAGCVPTHPVQGATRRARSCCAAHLPLCDPFHTCSELGPI